MTASKAEPVTIGDATVKPGRRHDFEIPVGRLPSDTTLSLPVAVLNGVSPGPRIWISAAIHGDEINGVEITRRVLDHINPKELSGTLVATPIVNVFGFIAGSRYLPDRRDLNRSFPGSPRGSLASRLASLFLETIVAECSFGVDLHTGSGGRTNHPQIRADLDDEKTMALANAFGAPIVVHARLRDGSLREEATNRGIPVLVYEGGQANRFDEGPIRAGTLGVLRLLHHSGMIHTPPERAAGKPVTVRSTKWTRARKGGILRLGIEPGAVVAKGEVLGEISDAFGQRPVKVRAPGDGHIIGLTVDPLVNPGDAIANIGFAEA